jgi:hypothetical protein
MSREPENGACAAAKRKIAALLAKTPANGATEPEAHAAYEKALALMQQYGIAPDEVGLEGEPAWYNPAKYQPDGANSTLNADAPHPFDYNALPADLATTLRGIALRVRTSSHKVVLDVGNELLAAKELLKHGKFLAHFSSYLDKELGMTLRSAENAMAAARFLGDPENEIFSNLPITALYLLSRRRTPKEVRAKVRNLLAGGERPTVDFVQQLLRAAMGGLQPSASASDRKKADEAAFNRTLENLSLIIVRHVPRPDLAILVSYLVKTKNMPIEVLEKYVSRAINADKFRKAA